MKKFLAAILVLLTSTAYAQEFSPEVERGIDSVKQKNFDFSAEVRDFDAAPEFLARYKNISADWIHTHDKNFFKLRLDHEIFSLAGTGVNWNLALHGVDENFAVLPSVGINLYARIRPRLDFYMQFSGLTFGNRAHVADIETGIKYFPRRDFSLSAGWREVNFKRNSNRFFRSGLFIGVRKDF